MFVIFILHLYPHDLLKFEMQIPLSVVMLCPTWLFSSLHMQPLMQPCWSPLCLVALLSMVTFPPQVLLSPLHPFVMPLVLSQIIIPHLLLCRILVSIFNPLVLFMASLLPWNSTSSLSSQNLLQIILTFRCLELWNAQIAFFHGITSLPHTSKMMVGGAVIPLPMAKCSTL